MGLGVMVKIGAGNLIGGGWATGAWYAARRVLWLGVSIDVDIKLLGGLLGLGVFLWGVEVGDGAPCLGQREGLVGLGFDVVLHALVALFYGGFQAACELG